MIPASPNWRSRSSRACASRLDASAILEVDRDRGLAGAALRGEHGDDPPVRRGRAVGATFAEDAPDGEDDRLRGLRDEEHIVDRRDQRLLEERLVVADKRHDHRRLRALPDRRDVVGERRQAVGAMEHDVQDPSSSASSVGRLTSPQRELAPLEDGAAEVLDRGAGPRQEDAGARAWRAANGH